jgi:hypothetical protein
MRLPQRSSFSNMQAANNSYHSGKIQANHNLNKNVGVFITGCNNIYSVDKTGGKLSQKRDYM